VLSRPISRCSNLVPSFLYASEPMKRQASQIRAPLCPSHATIVEPSSANIRTRFFPPRSSVFHPGPLLAHQALQELWPLSLIRLHTLRQLRFANPDLGIGHPRWREITKNDDYYFSFFCLAHLARAAFLALALLSSGVKLAARLFPPFEPPIFPNATA
jgi:hypothetical protein